VRELGRAERSRRRRDAIAIIENRDSVVRRTIVKNRQRREEEYRAQKERFYGDEYYKGNGHRQRSPICRRNEYY